MASPSNLLGLVTQLQNLEQSLTGLLMEMVVRISSLTDTKVFLLIETQEGRKLAGHRQFCQQYLEGSLAPVASDLLFDVDASLSSLRPVACFDRGMETGGEMNGGVLNGGMNGGGAMENGALSYRNDSPFPESFSRKRKYPDKTLSQLTPAQRQRPTKPQHRLQQLQQQHRLQQLQQQQKHPPSNSDSEVIVVKAEENDENWDDVAIMSEIDPTTNDAASNILPLESNAPTPTASREVTNLAFDEILDAYRQHDLNEENYLEVVETKLSVDKLQVVRSIDNDNACVKGNVEYKLVTSLCYDFGKALAEAKSFVQKDNVQRKTFHDAHFDKWIVQFSSLAPFFQTRCHNGRPEGGQTCTFLGLIRHVSRKAFLQRISRDEKMKESFKTMSVAALQYE